MSGKLAITRKIGESFVMRSDQEITAGTEIVVSVVGLERSGSRARLAIQAPREITILRSELIGTPNPKAA